MNWEKLYAVFEAVEYICKNRIPGDIVECGVWKGGCAMLMADILYRHQDKHRLIYLYDTFAGMSEPTEKDIQIQTGARASDKHARLQREGHNEWDYAPIAEVKSSLTKTRLPIERFRFVEGKVEDTIPATMPDEIALLHLDTDWYESTKHELIHLFPRLAKGGAFIADDYGHWLGSTTAVDEYFTENRIVMLLTRVYNSVVGVKQH